MSLKNLGAEHVNEMLENLRTFRVWSLIFGVGKRAVATKILLTGVALTGSEVAGRAVAAKAGSLLKKAESACWVGCGSTTNRV